MRPRTFGTLENAMTRLMCILSRLGSSRVHWCLALTIVLALGLRGPLLGQAKLGQPVGRAPETEKQELSGERPAQSSSKGRFVGGKSLNLPLEAPSRDQLFQVESEEKLRARMASEYLALGQKKVLFPEDAALPFSGKLQRFPPSTAVLETANICTRPLYFEEEATERHGIYCPLAQPLISTSRFYFNTLCLPLKMIVTPPWHVSGGVVSGEW